MICPHCLVAVGDICTLDIKYQGEYAGCGICSTSLNSFFPMEGEYLGREDGGTGHLYKIKEIACPGCGNKETIFRAVCKDDGGSLEMPLFIELPEEIFDETEQ